MLAPVVVKPETVSNKALVKSGISPFMIKGRHPNRLNSIQEKATVTKPSFSYITIFAGLLIIRSTPAATQMAATIINDQHAASP